MPVSYVMIVTRSLAEISISKFVYAQMCGGGRRAMVVVVVVVCLSGKYHFGL